MTATPEEPGAWCEVCQPRTLFPAGEILDHLRLMHPDQYGDGPEKWPDGQHVVVMNLDPEDFDG